MGFFHTPLKYANEQKRLDSQTAKDTFEAEQQPMANLPFVAQQAIQGAGETGQGILDLFGASGEYYDKKRQGLVDQQRDIALRTGSRGMDDIGALGDMARYIPDLGIAALTGGSSLTGSALGAAGKAIPKVGRMGAALDIGSPGTAGAIRKAMPYIDDELQGLESGFLKGDYRDDKTKSILDDFNPETAANDALLGGIMFGTAKGVGDAFKGKPKGIAKDRLDNAKTEGYKLGSESQMATATENLAEVRRSYGNEMADSYAAGIREGKEAFDTRKINEEAQFKKQNNAYAEVAESDNHVAHLDEKVKGANSDELKAELKRTLEMDDSKMGPLGVKGKQLTVEYLDKKIKELEETEHLDATSKASNMNSDILYKALENDKKNGYLSEPYRNAYEKELNKRFDEGYKAPDPKEHLFMKEGKSSAARRFKLEEEAADDLRKTDGYKKAKQDIYQYGTKKLEQMLGRKNNLSLEEKVAYQDTIDANRKRAKAKKDAEAQAKIDKEAARQAKIEEKKGPSINRLKAMRRGLSERLAKVNSLLKRKGLPEARKRSLAGERNALEEKIQAIDKKIEIKSKMEAKEKKPEETKVETETKEKSPETVKEEKKIEEPVDGNEVLNSIGLKDIGKKKLNITLDDKEPKKKLDNLDIEDKKPFDKDSSHSYVNESMNYEFNTQLDSFPFKKDKPTALHYTKDSWPFAKDRAAAYSIDDNTIHLREDASTGDIAHELGHAMSTREYMTNPKYKAAVDEVLKDFDYKGFSNEEILADMFANEELFTLMNTAKSRGRTVWETITTVIKHFLENKFNTKVNEGSVLSDVIELTEIYGGKYTEESIVPKTFYSQHVVGKAIDNAEGVLGEGLKKAFKASWKLLDKMTEHRFKDSALKKHLLGAGNYGLINKVLIDYGLKDSAFATKVQDYLLRKTVMDKETIDLRNYHASLIGETVGDLDKEALGKTIVGIDLQSLPEETLDALHSGELDIDARIRELEGELKGSKELGKGIDALVNQMLGKKAGSYATANAYTALEQFGVLSDKNIRLVDEIATLKAAKKSDLSEMRKLSSEQLEYIIKTHQKATDGFLDGKESYSYRKGYMNENLSSLVEQEHFSHKEWKSMKDSNEGWEVVSRTKDGVLVKRESTNVSYDSGVVPTKQEHSKGTNKFSKHSDFMKQAKVDRHKMNQDVYNKKARKYIESLGKEYQPLFDKNGYIINARVLASEDFKKKHLDSDLSIDSVLGNMIMQNERDLKYKKFIKEINDEFVVNTKNVNGDDIMNEFKDDLSFMMLKGTPDEIQAKLSENFLKEHYELVDKSIMPKGLKGISYVRKGFKDEMIGYKNDLIGTNRTANLSEVYWRDAVDHFRSNVIGKNPIAIATNLAGNFIMLAGEGVPVKDMLKYGVSGRKNITRLMKDTRELERAKINGDKAKIDSLTKRIDENPAKVGMDEGFYQSMIDDYYTDTITSPSRISLKTEKYLRDKLDKSLGEKGADLAMDSMCNLFMTPSSSTGKGINKFVSYSDYVARYIMYHSKKTTSGNVVDKAAAKIARDSFVDYRKTLPKELNWLRKSGIVPFMTWAYRMQPVIAKQALNHPIRVGALYGTYLGMSGGQDDQYVENVRVGGWFPQNAFLDASIVSPANPYNMVVPEFWDHVADGNLAAMAGIRLQ